MDAQELRRYISGCGKEGNSSGTQETLGYTTTFHKVNRFSGTRQTRKRKKRKKRYAFAGSQHRPLFEGLPGVRLSSQEQVTVVPLENYVILLHTLPGAGVSL
jgi:hypothetical protein